jgi:hypothetical protein
LRGLAKVAQRYVREAPVAAFRADLQLVLAGGEAPA